MALHPIGSEDAKLLYIETRAFTLTIKGKPVHPVACGLGIIPENLTEHYVATLSIEGEYSQAACFDPKAKDQLAPYAKLQPVFACFYEQTPYEIVIEQEGRQEISFYHRDQYLRNAVKPVGRRQTLTGMLNFRNDIGLSTFEVRVGGLTALRVTLEIFPVKLRYKEEYWQLLHEVNREVYNLAFDFLRRTYLQAKLNSRRQSSLAEFYSIVSFLFERLRLAFARVRKSPHQRIVTDHALVRPERVRRTDHASRRWLERHPHELQLNGHGLQVGGAKYLPRRMLDARKRVSYDTYENRMLKWMLGRVQERLGELRRRYLRGSRPDGELVRSIERMLHSTRLMLEAEFLRECGPLTRLDGQSLVLQMAPGYREIYRYYLMLTKGLSLQGEIFQLSVKDVAQLYEYWCFLALGSILRQRYRMKRQSAIAIRGEGLVVVLDTRHSAELEFENEETGERYVLSFNTRQPELPTVSQRPDSILTLHKANSDVAYRYVFDAKYRIDPALPGTRYREQYHKPGPQEDDINTMHRYRDALVYRQAGGEYKRGAFGAVILFPYADEERYAGVRDGQAHRFLQSIEQVGIGGLPFLPGHTSLVERLLDDLILASPETVHEQGGETEGTEQYYEERFARRNVMVGVANGSDHLEYHLRTRTYHIPADQLHRGWSHIEYVALYEPAGASADGLNGVRRWGRVVNAKLVERSEIAIPSRRRRPTGQYVLFEVDKWQNVGPVVPAGYGVRRRIYTTPYLLKRARQLPELSLKSEDEIRLWKELQRLSEAVQVNLTTKQLDEDTAVEGFEIAGKTVKVVGDEILLDGQPIGTVHELRVMPMRIVKVLRRLDFT
jgi:predicted component of viral defense system (DUF524 family)